MASPEPPQGNHSDIKLKDNYITYEQALKDLNLKTLFARREKVLLKFWKKCTILPQIKHLFPLNNQEHNMHLRKTEKYHVLNAHTSRLNNSTVPYIQKLDGVGPVDNRPSTD